MRYYIILFFVGVNQLIEEKKICIREKKFSLYSYIYTYRVSRRSYYSDTIISILWMLCAIYVSV